MRTAKISSERRVSIAITFTNFCTISSQLASTAIACAEDAPLMAQAMGMAAVSGRLGYLAGRIPVAKVAIASSPQTGTINS